MNKSTIFKHAAVDAVLTAVYVALIASFFFYAPHIFGNGPDKSLLIPIMMLLLFVVSAAITGSLVLGRPVMWYLDGKKSEALALLGYTIGVLVVILAVVAAALVLVGA